MLKELELEEKELLEKLGNVRKSIKEEKLRIIEVEFGIRIGSIVKDGRGVEHRITSIKPGYKTLWLEGNPKKKDGTFGIAVRNIYGDWEVIAI